MTMMAGVEQRRDGNNANWVSPGQARREAARSRSLSHTYAHLLSFQSLRRGRKNLEGEEFYPYVIKTFCFK